METTMHACTPTLLAGLRERLIARQAELRRELAAADEARRSERWLDSHEVSDLKDIAERRLWTDQISTQERRDLAEFRDLEAALQRLDEGRYGTCVACGEAIADERLRVQPAAPRCTACQTAQERAEHTHSHLHM
jgi:RNA polymerase-binding transcription factor DksA